MSTELLDESPLYQAWRREAREEGHAEGLRESARAALAGRFGTLDEALLAAINTASEEALLDLLAHIAEPLDQLRARLGSK